MADAVLGDAVPVSPDIGSLFKLPGADNEHSRSAAAADARALRTDPRPPSALEDDGFC